MIRIVTLPTSKQQSKQRISLQRASLRAFGTQLSTCWEYRRMSHSFHRKARLPLQNSSALSVCFSGPSLLFLSPVLCRVFLSFIAFFHRVPFRSCLICLCHQSLFYFRRTQNRRTTACGEPPSQRLRATLTHSSLLTA